VGRSWRPLIALDTRIALRACWSFWTAWTFGTGWSDVALRSSATGRTGRADIAGVALVALRSLRASRAHRPCLSGWACLACWSGVTAVALGSRWSLWTGITLGTGRADRAGRPRLARRTGQSLGTGHGLTAAVGSDVNNVPPIIASQPCRH
jgi:hypothetical protein